MGDGKSVGDSVAPGMDGLGPLAQGGLVHRMIWAAARPKSLPETASEEATTEAGPGKEGLMRG